MGIESAKASIFSTLYKAQGIKLKLNGSKFRVQRVLHSTLDFGNPGAQTVKVSMQTMGSREVSPINKTIVKACGIGKVTGRRL